MIDLRLISLHKRQMRAAESRIAGALAAWKLYEFMYPEFAIEPIASQSASELRKSYRSFMGSMRLDVYVEQFAHQVEAVLRQLDADFIIQDRLAGVGSGPARSVASVRQQPGQAAAAAKMLGN